MTKLRKIPLMHRLFGITEDHTCGECSNFVSGKYKSRVLRKCKVYGLTHSEASDWAKRWTACGLFNKEYYGTPVIVLKQEPQQEEPMEGQITFDEWSVKE